MNGLLRRCSVLPRYALFPREIFRRDEEDRRRRCRGHRRGGLTKYPAEKIRGTAGVVRELCGLRLFQDTVEGEAAQGEPGAGSFDTRDPEVEHAVGGSAELVSALQQEAFVRQLLVAQAEVLAQELADRIRFLAGEPPPN